MLFRRIFRKVVYILVVSDLETFCQIYLYFDKFICRIEMILFVILKVIAFNLFIQIKQIGPG